MSYNIYDENVYQQLHNSNINFTDKIVLDIGSRNGINCISMVKLGAKKVIGVDIDDTKFATIDSFNDKEKEKVKLVKSNIFDFQNDKLFDIVTCFLWNISLCDYDKIINKIKVLLKPNGLILIGIHDDLYKYGYEGLANTGSVIELINKNFNVIYVLNKKDAFQWIIKCENH